MQSYEHISSIIDLGHSLGFSRLCIRRQ